MRTFAFGVRRATDAAVLVVLVALTFPGGAVSAEVASTAGESSGAKNTPTVLAEAEFFERLYALIEAEQWGDAREMILAARGVNPPLEWLARRDAELRFVQCRTAHELGSTTEMLTAARLYLNGDNARSRKMLELAREIYPADQAHAIELAKEVRRKSPDYPPVRRLLAEWQPRAKP